MLNKTYDIAVIGGGPAGISAALTASEQGASVLLVEERTLLGGNYYKELTVGDRQSNAHQNSDFAHLKKALKKSSVDILLQTGVWGVFDQEGNALTAQTEDVEFFSLQLTSAVKGNATAICKTLILATGVYDRPLPFPGWELPGVVTPGGVQMQLEKQGILPGKKVLVAGTGPLQMLVAASLAKNGVEVVAVLDTCAALEGVSSIFPALPALKHRLREGLDSFLTLKRYKVPMLFRHAVFKAHGTEHNGVEAVTIGKVDREGNPLWDTKQVMNVDTVCVAYGFIPSTAMTMHLGCEHDFDENLQTFIPKHDEKQRSSQTGIFLAGDMTGVGGKHLAELQGRNAAISALETLGKISDADVQKLRSRLKAGIKIEKIFAKWLWKRQRIRPGLLKIATDETLLCRCEAVSVGTARESIQNGAHNLFGVKLRTRMSMGQCQGRYCLANTALLITQECNIEPSTLPEPSIRPPIFPLRLGDIEKPQEVNISEK